MKAGYLDNLDSMDFTLPKDHSFVGQILPGTRTEGVEVYLGMEGWTDKGYIGRLYPAKTKAKDFLKHYCTSFNTVEVNATRYVLPKPTTVEQWHASTDSNFKFAVKVPQYISHQRKLDTDEVLEDLDSFINSMSLLQDKLAITYLQLPSSFKVSRIDELHKLVEHFPDNIDLAVELRDPRFYEDPKVLSDIGTFLASYNVGMSISDTPERRDILHMMLTNKIAYIRVMGNRLHVSDYTRADEWVKRITEWISLGLKKLFLFVHQPSPNKVMSADLIKYIAEKLNKDAGTQIMIPELLK